MIEVFVGYYWRLGVAADRGRPATSHARTVSRATLIVKDLPVSGGALRRAAVEARATVTGRTRFEGAG